MKLLQYIYYFFRSLYYRGFKHTFKLLTYENLYEKRLGIATHRIENLDQLTLAGENSNQHHHYQGASYYVLFLVFGKLPKVAKSGSFIDFGCGKGRALFVAEQCGFTQLIGVDIAKELIDDAEKNKLVYQKKNEHSHIDFVFSDATTYSIPKDTSVFYFFNPFGKDILQNVINRIKESLALHPRKVFCVYLNPTHKHLFIESGFDVFDTIRHKRYIEGLIYTNNFL